MDGLASRSERSRSFRSSSFPEPNDRFLSWSGSPWPAVIARNPTARALFVREETGFQGPHPFNHPVIVNPPFFGGQPAQSWAKGGNLQFGREDCHGRRGCIHPERSLAMTAILSFLVASVRDGANSFAQHPGGWNSDGYGELVCPYIRTPVSQ